MKFSKLQLAAILKLGMEVADLEDKEKTNEEFEVILQELSYLGVDVENDIESLLEETKQFSMNDALSLISNMSDEQQREICGYVGAIICADGALGPNEKSLWDKFPEWLGFGKMTLEEALEIYKGENNSHFQRINFKNGGYYEGEVRNGLYNGKGKIVFSNGDVKEGNFVNGQLNGQGSYTWPSGDKYVGEFKDGKFTGFGEYFYKNGSRYRGSWSNDQKSGFGLYFYEDGGVSFDEYANDQRHGKSIYINGNEAQVCQYSNGECISRVKYSGMDYSDLMERIQTDNQQNTIV